ncbi:phosphoenolpyruvate synthase [Patescibacteria group bacterium]|nr:phosphoenolpyruvate synthase [Patescibacteria group bacterium]MBU1663392.1 phosphoenolpyruvate synthase [Patescibacteria group bacterium]MBU1933749.1 phosphoenolpyruvate synthase [Patescibacteria group bacterium]MBU2008044.1 phosphoenolpyruvate synthase [Patescibacteria group bacterium]MBU2233738.1 phosphoenolpyruvate synthase [Patescibacteria group bacterium]
MSEKKFIKFFEETTIKDVPEVGGKNASLGEMYKTLADQGIKVPNGFAVTASAYNYLLEQTHLKKNIKNVLDGLNTHDVTDLAKRGAAIRKLIVATAFPKDLSQDIVEAYKKLSQFYKTKNLHVAVRSSATAEDLPDASFAGQQETFLNISGEVELLLAVKKCIASLFTNRAISYRVDKGFDHFKIALSVGVQKMIRSDLAASGVIFTIDTESGFANTVLISSIYGLGENIVQGKVDPDEFYVFKPTKTIISRSISRKKIKMIYSANPKHPVKDVKVPEVMQCQSSITDAQVLELADWAMQIEKHYGRAMDIEWALDGKENQLYIIQARPETIHSVRDYNVIEEYVLEKKSLSCETSRNKIISTGRSVGNRIGAGLANRIMDIKNIAKFKPGEVLVTDMTDPDWEPIMKIASAIVTDKGGRTCHAAIVSRELGIPCVVGTSDVSKKIKTGQAITASCAQGDIGFVYEGKLPFKINKTSIKNLAKPKTKIMMNIGSPDIAFLSSFIPNDGVGLAREEFIINDQIKIHPLALINYAKLKDKKVKKKIDELTIGYKDKKQYYIDKLAQGMAIITAAFYPNDVIIRFSDFKTNEYANLIGGADYEPVEANPMIGWRGASRYYTPQFKPAFELECEAIKKVRNEMKLTNLKAMVPFCRTIKEAEQVIKIMADNGLKQGENNFELYCMVEIPSNVILAEDFAKLYDGFSIGSNDLTQLTLGVDRDSSLVSQIYDENNAAIKKLIKQVIEVAKKTKTKIGICGQAPSDFPDFAQFLVECGIDSISLNPDTVIKTTITILETEKKLNRNKSNK